MILLYEHPTPLLGATGPDHAPVLRVIGQESAQPTLRPVLSRPDKPGDSQNVFRYFLRRASITSSNSVYFPHHTPRTPTRTNSQLRTDGALVSANANSPPEQYSTSEKMKAAFIS